MKINAKILSIPPYLSTSWEHVRTLQVDPNGCLVVYFKNESKISIPNLHGDTIEEIFTAHSEYLEKKEHHSLIPSEETLNIDLSGGGIGLEGMENLTGMMQHDLSQKDSDNLPNEILSKIGQITKLLGLGSPLFQIPKGEPHCNCPFCQIARVVHESSDETSPSLPEIEEEVPDAELKFREWDIKQVGEKLYDITNPLLASEHYQVFLGNPIGCTCGKNKCEHIVAVLNS